MFDSKLRAELTATKTRLVITEFTLRALTEQLAARGVLSPEDLAELTTRTRDLLRAAADDIQRRKREGRGRTVDKLLDEVVQAAYMEVAQRAD